MSAELITLTPLVILGLGGVAVFCLGAFWTNRPAGWVWGLALLAAITATLTEITAFRANGLPGLIDFSGYGLYFALVLSAIVLLSLLFLRHYALERGFDGDELYGLVLLAGLGMVLAAVAANWIMFFLGFELLSISLYILAAINRSEPGSQEAGLKYFVMGAVASGFLAFGLALLYAATGRLDIEAGLSAIDPDHLPLALLAFGFLLTGLGFKLSIVPFHLWTPDVYQGAPAPVVAFLSTGAKVSLLALLMRVMAAAPQPVWTALVPVLWLLAAATMIVGNVTALRQANLKRRLAYSSIAQMGYLLMALVALRPDGLAAMMFYLAVYGVMDMGAFGILGSYRRAGQDLGRLSDYQGFGFSHPWRTAGLTLCLLSLAGLPPTAGFIGKLLVFKAALSGGAPVLALVGILTVIVSVYYYLEVIVYLYMREPEKGAVASVLSLSDRAAWVLVSGLTLLLGVAPSPLISSLNRIASAVLSGVGIGPQDQRRSVTGPQGGNNEQSAIGSCKSRPEYLAGLHQQALDRVR